MKFTFLVIIFMSLSSFSFATEKGKWTSEWIPERKKVFHSLFADPWESKQTIFWLNDYKLRGQISGSFMIYSATLKDALSQIDKKFQTYVDLLTFNSMRYRIEEGGGFDLDTSDTKFGLQCEYKQKNVGTRLGFQHISAHLADGLLWPVHKKSKQSYSREFLQFNISYDFPHFIPYGGIHYIFSQRHPKEYEGNSFFTLQWGGEILYPTPFKNMDAFFAADWQSKEEYTFFINQSYFSGLRFKGVGLESIRMGFHFYTGHDPRGEFYNSKTTVWGFGFIV